MHDTPSSGNWPFLPLGIALATLGAVLARIVVFWAVDWRILTNVMLERQYYRWANEFNRTGSENGATELNNSKALLHQYRPWWLAAVLVIGAAGLLVMGIEIRVMFWVRAPSAAILIETCSRVTFELLWLRTRASVICKRFLMRWVPRVNIHLGFLS